MKSVALFGLALAALPSVLAQGGAYAQCGGTGWTGATSCVAGYTCVFSNAYYSQCLPAPSTTAKPPTSTSKASSTAPKSSTSSTSSAPTASGTNAVKTWFSFGDSYTQTQFSVTGVQPSKSNPFGNPSYPGNTACGNVPNWIDYCATTYNSTIVEVFNHAYGGATIDSSLVTPYESTVLSVADQVNNFLTYDAPGKQYYSGWSSSNTLFSVWIGINDIGNTYGSGGDRDAFDDTLLNRYFQLVQSLYTAGARHFLFLGVPPVNRSPLMISQGTSAQTLEASVISDYNSKLSTRASSFASSNAGATAIYYDTGPVINAVLNSPSTYGIQDATSYGTGNQYAWCNNLHISPPVHNQVAKGVSALIKGTYI